VEVHPGAARPPELDVLVDVDRLVDADRLGAAYYDDAPDPSVAEHRVSFGTSGHRGSSLPWTGNEAHIAARQSGSAGLRVVRA
jgi:phosphoglucomutase